MAARARTTRPAVDLSLTFRHGVRRDGMEWITVTHPSMPNLIRLSMPHDPDYGGVQLAFTNWVSARKAKSIALEPIIA